MFYATARHCGPVPVSSSSCGVFPYAFHWLHQTTEMHKHTCYICSCMLHSVCKFTPHGTWLATDFHPCIWARLQAQARLPHTCTGPQLDAAGQRQCNGSSAHICGLPGNLHVRADAVCHCCADLQGNLFLINIVALEPLTEPKAASMQCNISRLCKLSCSLHRSAGPGKGRRSAGEPLPQLISEGQIACVQ